MTRTPSEIVDVDTKQLDEVLRRAEASLNSEDFELTKAVFQSYAYLASAPDRWMPWNYQDTLVAL